ncbi:MAG TPA: hypothetical protein VI488_00635 [Candidatus Angelobacter sp.]
MEEKVFRIRFDAIPCGPSAPGEHAIILVGLRDGATPQIFKISWPVFRDRLISILGFSVTRAFELDKVISATDRIIMEPIEATMRQLQALGFEGI